MIGNSNPIVSLALHAFIRRTITKQKFEKIRVIRGKKETDKGIASPTVIPTERSDEGTRYLADSRC